MMLVLFDQLFFFGYGLEINHRKIATLFEGFIFVQYISHTAGHACGKVAAGIADHQHTAACHIFAAVVAHTFDHGHSAGVANGKTLARHATEVSFAGDCAVKHGVANNDGFISSKTNIVLWLDDDLAT